MNTMAVNVVFSVTNSGDQSSAPMNVPSFSVQDGSPTMTASVDGMIDAKHANSGCTWCAWAPSVTSAPSVPMMQL